MKNMWIYTDGRTDFSEEKIPSTKKPNILGSQPTWAKHFNWLLSSYLSFHRFFLLWPSLCHFYFAQCWPFLSSVLSQSSPRECSSILLDWVIGNFCPYPRMGYCHKQMRPLFNKSILKIQAKCYIGMKSALFSMISLHPIWTRRADELWVLSIKECHLEGSRKCTYFIAASDLWNNITPTPKIFIACIII